MLRKLIYLIVVFGWALAHTASADLVGFWEFEDAAGGVIKDSSGNGNPFKVLDFQANRMR